MAAKNPVPFLQKFIATWKGLDTALRGVKVVSAGRGRATFSMTVEESQTNSYGTLHGGFSAHIVDNMSTLALATVQEEFRPGVSVAMNLTYMKPAKVGEEIIIEARALKAGKTMAFLECEIRNKDEALLVKGSHTKFIG